MASFPGHQSFHGHHAHAQWGPAPIPPPYYVGFSAYVLVYPSPFATYQPGWDWNPYQVMMPPALSPAPTTQIPGTPILPILLQKQIEYYFSEDNLARDRHLKLQMDEEGWVSVHTIAGFPRVKALTNNEGLIMWSLWENPTVEAKEGKMRRRGTWRKWLLPR